MYSDQNDVGTVITSDFDFDLAIQLYDLDGTYLAFDLTYLTIYVNLITATQNDMILLSSTPLKNPFVPCSQIHGRRPFPNISQAQFTANLDNNYTLCLDTTMVAI